MMKRCLAALFLAVLFPSFSFAQASKTKNEVPWEFLEISEVTKYCNGYLRENPCRSYAYPGSGQRVYGPIALDWISASGWELVGVTFQEQNTNKLYFKRRYNKERTERETAWLQKELEKVTEQSSTSQLKDLDKIEYREKLDDFNKNEELKLRTALQQIKSFPLKIIEVKSISSDPKTPFVAAEIMIDGTAAILKDGGVYRSSEVEKFFQEAAKQIIDSVKLTSKNPINSGAWAISQGSYTPQIGNLPIYYGSELTLRVSVFVDYQNRQNIVAQEIIYGKR